ncbi:MAG TPA: hypothetical protein VGJ45_38825 [Pseudonocardiaceae bacterium]
MNGTPEDDDIIDGSVVEDSTVDARTGADLALPGTYQPTELATDYTNEGVPNFDFVRDKIESRFATSLGSTELAGMTPEAATVEDQFAKREQAGKDKLEEIRRAMRGE